MQKNKKIFFDVVFFILAAGEILSHIISSEILHFIFKPLLLIWLSFYFYWFARNKFSSYTKLIFAGFVFSWVGDVFLIFEGSGEEYFLMGLGSFLVTHIFYITAFINSVKGKKSFIKKHPVIILPFVIVLIVNLYMLYPKLNSLFIPVAIYACTIMTMVLCAVNRKFAVGKQNFGMIFLGGILFMVSDSAISTAKFLSPFPYSEVFIMVTYIAAQYLIMRGSLLHITESQ